MRFFCLYYLSKTFVSIPSLVGLFLNHFGLIKNKTICKKIATAIARPVYNRIFFAISSLIKKLSKSSTMTDIDKTRTTILKFSFTLFLFRAIQHPTHSKFILQHSKYISPKLLCQRHSYCATFSQLIKNFIRLSFIIQPD